MEPPAGPGGSARFGGGAHRVAGALLLVLALAGTIPAVASGAPLTPSALPGEHATGIPSVHPIPLDSGGGWTTYHGTEDRSGYYPLDGPATSGTLWVNCPSTQPIRVGPVLDAQRLYLSDDLGTEIALNRTVNGSAVWRTPLGTTPTTADVAGTTLVVGGSDGYLTGLATSTGALLWSSKVGAPVVQGVAVDNSTVFAGLSDGHLVAVSLSTGSKVWSVSLGGPAAGVPAVDRGELFEATTNGTVVALTESGSLVWSRSVGANITSAVATLGTRLVVGDESGNVTAFSTSGGPSLWHTAVGGRGDRIESTPALTPTSVYASTDLGIVAGIDLSNGTLRWSHPMAYAGYRVLASPVATPDYVYVVDATEYLDSFRATDGKLLWQASLAGTASYTTPALAPGLLYAANDAGCVYEFGSAFGGRPWPVFGTVLNASGPPLAGATVTVGGTLVVTDPNGRFNLSLPNGTYRFDVAAGGYVPVSAFEVVNGGLGPIVFRLVPLPLYVVTGVIRDGSTGHPIPGANVSIFGAYGFVRWTLTDRLGQFRLSAPNGSDYLSVGPPPGFAGLATHVDVAGASTAPVVLSLTPTNLAIGVTDPARLDVVVPLLVLVLAAAAFGAWGLAAERERLGEGPVGLTPLGRFVARRVILIPVQALVILTVLFVFGTFFPALVHGADPCTPSAGACQTCSWSSFSCVAGAFGHGLWIFLRNLFTGSWGYASYNHLSLPAAQFLGWWAPNSIELALFALPISAAIAYPLGLISGWRRDGVVDVGVRVSSLVGLLVPSFLVVLVLLSGAYGPFTSALGDTPYGLLPTPVWFASNGGQPPWIGIGSNTSPTGFPIVDGAIHGDWTFEEIVIAKTLVQALAIAVLYAAIFLRFARHAVAQAAGAPYIGAARARGVTDRTLLWHHTGRRVLPVFVLIFGLTIPVYIGTQALVEALFSDQGVGTLLLGEMTHVQSTAFGFATASQGYHVGNFYQVTIFLLVFLVLLGNLFSDVLARVLDPKEEERGGR